MFKRFKTLCTKKMGSHLWTSRLRTRHVRATLVRTGQWEPLSRQKRTHGQRPVKSSAWRDFLRDMLHFHGKKRGTERPFFRSVAHLGMCKWELFFFFLKNRGGLYRIDVVHTCAQCTVLFFLCSKRIRSVFFEPYRQKIQWNFYDDVSGAFMIAVRLLNVVLFTVQEEQSWDLVEKRHLKSSALAFTLIDTNFHT